MDDTVRTQLLNVLNSNPLRLVEQVVCSTVTLLSAPTSVTLITHSYQGSSWKYLACGLF